MHKVFGAIATIAILFSTASTSTAQVTPADSGVRGGLVVSLDFKDAADLAALRVNNSYIVEGLDTDQAKVALASRNLKELGVAGKVTAAVFDGRSLPYTDNVVNLLVADGLGDIAEPEVLRVLCPGGVALIGGRRIVKPVPESIDQWTHYLHDASNNAVAHDTEVGPPRHMQWLGGPRWTRTHHKLNSVSSVVSAAGRLFYIVDESSAASWNVPSRWEVVARDAFSGVQLWRRKIESWKELNTAGFRSGPPELTRLLIAKDDKVYAPLAKGAPVQAMDAATGETLASYDATAGVDEMILADDVLVALCTTQGTSDAPVTRRGAATPGKCVVAMDTLSGKKLWGWADDPLIPMPETLGADDGRVYFQVNNSVVCLDLRSGEELWTHGDRGTTRHQQKGYGKSVLVISDGVVLCNLSGQLTAMDASTGNELWSMQGGNGFHAPMDVFVINGIVYTGIHPQDSVSPPPVHDFAQLRDLKTGEIISENSVMVDIQTSGHHHRCYREKATTNYIIAGKRGFEMMNLTGDDHSRNNWVRGTCQYGMMPANGLTYAPPHSCGCYMESMLWGFWALAPERQLPAAIADSERLVKGTAFGKVTPVAPADTDWAQFRGGPMRSGSGASTLPGQLKPSWKIALGGRLTQPVIAAGTLLTADVDSGTVYAFDPASGDKLWDVTVSGRVDSPPAIFEGMAIFGSANGWVYAVRLTDGALVWKFFAAPADVKTVAMDQVESLWPVHGSALILDGVAYVSAGRSTWLDGGIALYGLDPATGAILHKSHYASTHPDYNRLADVDPAIRERELSRTDQNMTDYKTAGESDLSDAFSMEGGTIRDILVSDGQNVFLHTAQFDAELNRKEKATRHIFSTSGLLDDMENHRSHFVFGTGDFSDVPVAYSWVVNGSGNRKGNAMVRPTGLMMVFDRDTLWGVKRSGGKYSVYKTDIAPLTGNEKPGPDFVPGGSVPTMEYRVGLGCRPRAMIQTDGKLYFGGVPGDMLDNTMGAATGQLVVVSAETGEELAAYPLASAVRWDGMSTAGGGLYLVTESGELQCWE